jgi:YfiH family protein
MKESRRIPLIGGSGDRCAAIPIDAGLEHIPALFAGITLADSGDMGLYERFPPAGGDAPPAEGSGRHAFLGSLGWAEDRVFGPRQMHSRSVVIVDGRKSAEVALTEADGLVTAGREPCLLTVTVADCLPIFLADAAHGAFGIVHSGWKGTGIVGDAIRTMMEAFGTSPSRLSVTIGPGIGTCCYKVDEDRYHAFKTAFGERAVRRDEEGGFFLDLPAANLGLLSGMGIRGARMVDSCTACNPVLGSFRRQGPRGFTRMLAFIGPFRPGK